MKLRTLSLLTLGLGLAGCTASLRPAEVSVSPVDPSAEAQGRRLLAAAADKHGLAAFKGAQTLSYQMHDHWQGMLAALGNPWPASKIDVKMTFKTGTFDARAEFVSGEHKGLVWGLQSWKSYKQAPGQAPVFEEDEDLSFILPAVQYLLEFPFRAQHADIVTYAGREVVNGRSYDRIFVTWGSYEAHTGADQYVAYIDRERGLITKVQYTVREFARFAKGTVHYDDMRNVGGLMVPMVQTITSEPSDDTQNYLHRMTLVPESVAIDGEPATLFVVDPELAPAGDHKMQESS